MVLNCTPIDNGITTKVMEKYTQQYQRPHNKDFFSLGKENIPDSGIKNKKKAKKIKKERFTSTITYSATAPTAPANMTAGPTLGNATVVPPKPAVVLSQTMISQQELINFGKLYTRSDTVDENDENAYNPNAPGSTPKIDPNIGKAKSYRVPTDEDMICWLHKYFSLLGPPWTNYTLKTFTDAITADGMSDSGRKNKSQQPIMIENSELWNTMKNRAREYVELWLENDVDFAAAGVPEPYCLVEPTLTNEQAAAAYDDQVKANPLVALVGTDETSPAQAEYGASYNDGPPSGCEPRWMYRKCEKNDKKEKKCRKLKGPERKRCIENAQGCNADPNWCVKRTGIDALMAFMRSFTNVKLLYLFLILGPLILGFIFPPFMAFSSLGFMGAMAITPLVGYIHFYRLFGPGSSIFEALPYFIRWYFWYPMILLISKPAKLFKIVGKGFNTFFSKTIPNWFIKLFTKQIPKLVDRIVTPIVTFATMLFDVIGDFFATIGSSIMGFIKVVAMFFENVGREIGILFKNIILTPINGIMQGLSGFEKFFKDIGKAFGQISGLSKAINRVIKKMGLR